MTGVIEIVPYDAQWVAEFEAEAVRLRLALGALALRIDHHGSTAVPGLSAKPIIDIQVSVKSLQPLRVCGARLESIGYVHRPHPDDRICPFFYRPHAWPHTHHVHLVEYGGLEERRTLAFRDYLREHDPVAREYEQLKRDLAGVVSPSDPDPQERYAGGKTAFVERIVVEAINNGYPKGL
jgi:GrpB-like predicted nucleotidyltransferase (UPF0157 family)